MNLIEKLQLIQEIQNLTTRLQQPSLALFERAKAHQHLKDIFQSCDEAIFQKQVSAFKERVYPDVALQQRLLNSTYQFSFCGLFDAREGLQPQLNSAADTCWGLTYHKKKGWEVGLNSPEQKNPIYYPAESLEQCFNWLAECHQNGSLKSDDQLQPVIPVLATMQITTRPVLSKPIVRVPLESAALNENTADKKTPLTAAVSTTYLSPSSHKKTPFQPLPAEFKLEELQVRLNPLKSNSAQQESLYQLVIQQHEYSAFLDLYSCSADPEKLINHPVYLAEQINRKGCFIQYVALLGAENQMQAMRLLMQIAGIHKQELAAIKVCEWPDFKTHFGCVESLYQLYSAQEKTLWKKAKYQSYIPVSLLHIHKFIAFEETPANYDTPLILLKERQKIRVVHGQSRLQLSATESVYPYLLLDRQDTVTWQLIQQTLQQLTPPIQAEQLYEAILQHLKAADSTKIA